MREALRDLQLLRLVESEPFRGARVRAVDDTHLLPVFPCARRSRTWRSRGREGRGRRAGARAAVAEMRRAAGRGDWRTQISADLAFHRAMVEMADNEPLLQSWLVLGIDVHGIRDLLDVLGPVDLADFHVPIVDAIRSGDASRAGAEARKHVRRTERVVRRRTQANAKREAAAAASSSA